MVDLNGFDRILLVANPVSGGGRAGRAAGRAAEGLRALGCRPELVHTEAAGDGLAAARDAGDERCLLVAVGGDGTVNELLNGADLERHTLTVVPCGTGNVFAKELGIGKDPERVVEQWRSGRVVRLDVGRCNGRRFASMFGAGIDAHAVQRVTEARSGTLTQLHYLPSVARALLRVPRWYIGAEIDGEAAVRCAQQVVVGNSCSYGGPVQMTPAAAPNDGLLDVMSARLNGPLRVAGVLSCCVLRSLHLSRLVSYRRGRRVRVTAAREGVPYELDGEPAGVLPAELAVESAALRVLAPASFHPVRREPADS